MTKRKSEDNTFKPDPNLGTGEWKKRNLTQKQTLEAQERIEKIKLGREKNEAKAAIHRKSLDEIIADLRRQKGYSRSQMNFEDCMLEFAGLCYAFAKANAYSNRIWLGDQKELFFDQFKTFVKDIPMAGKLMKLPVYRELLMAIAFIPFVVKTAKDQKNPDLTVPTSPIRYKIYNDANGKLMRVFEKDGETDQAKLKDDATCFDTAFVKWLQSRGYQYEEANQRFFNPSTNEVLNAENFVDLNTQGESLEEYCKENEYMQVEQDSNLITPCA